MSKCVFVMGANSAIAQELVQLCVSAGQEVIAAGRDTAVLEALYGHIAGVNIVEVQACESESVNAAFDELAAQGKQIDGYAHCVGSILVAPLTKTSDAQIDSVLQVNLISAMYGLRAFLKQAKTNAQGGSAVLVSTCATGIGVPNHEAIAAAKGGIEGLAKSAAATHASDNIRINVVAPGLTDSPIASAFLKSDVMRAASAKQYPLHGVNTPLEVAQSMHWLLSESSNRMTGAVLNIDGGFRNIRPLVK
ncbi:SDR family NAD(P)-dependent oxidoreductase [Limnobacter parvus]|uniref:SDR family oxidoreductase n=1 Tax=Limnobacter parvus TaxID=2939690 RepID=A0ABT1XDR8_9BURK|nr:SDR family oxidoreductase [Limnobacter parvus]MCR2745029.1 SDR family oxidoreductase [Limnobacter parvus]